MSVYKNCFRLMEDVRRGLNEYSTAYAQATDTSGNYTNDQIVDEINLANRFLYSLLLPRLPGVFLNSSNLTASSSVLTLPTDFGKLRILKDPNDKVCYQRPIKNLTPGTSGNTRLFYRKGDTYVIEKTSVTAVYVVWYEKKARDLDQGKAAGTDTLATSAVPIADYYNGMDIENVTDGEIDEITDYSAGRVVTHVAQIDANDYYGIISDIPEPFHNLLSSRAIIRLKDLHPASMEKSTEGERTNFIENLTETLRAYAGQSIDLPPKETDYFGPQEAIISNRTERGKQ